MSSELSELSDDGLVSIESFEEQQEESELLFLDRFKETENNTIFQKITENGLDNSEDLDNSGNEEYEKEDFIGSKELFEQLVSERNYLEQEYEDKLDTLAAVISQRTEAFTRITKLSQAIMKEVIEKSQNIGQDYIRTFVEVMTCNKEKEIAAIETERVSGLLFSLLINTTRNQEKYRGISESVSELESESKDTLELLELILEESKLQISDAYVNLGIMGNNFEKISERIRQVKSRLKKGIKISQTVEI